MNIYDLTEKIEKISQGYARKFQITRDQTWFVLKLQEEMGELIQSYLMMTGQGRSKGKEEKHLRQDFEEEVIDVLCHTLLLAKHFHIDLEKNISDKWLKYEKKN